MTSCFFSVDRWFPLKPGNVTPYSHTSEQKTSVHQAELSLAINVELGLEINSEQSFENTLN